jgi:3-deoxy-manno-octulosonate cytidylyltransferase (CMP-KDO synthetase)
MSNIKVAVVIPARLKSTRFPRKVLADIHGKPMIQHVYRGCHAEGVSEVFVATEDDEIVGVVEGFGGIAINTGPAVNVIERCSMAANHELLDGFGIIVIVQGDEPMVKPGMIERAIEALADGNHEITCCYKELDEGESPYNVNIIKAVLKNRNFEFGWFSRAPIPVLSPEKDYADTHINYYKQVCIMAFRSYVLAQYRKLPICSSEAAEGIDLLRFLENGIEIGAVFSPFRSYAVDVPEDLDKVRKWMKKDDAA